MDLLRRSILPKTVITFAAIAAFSAAVTDVRAVILLGTGDPSVNTTAPTGVLVNSGWQFEGQWGDFLGTVIAPNYFITASHVGGSIGQSFRFGGVNYTTVADIADPSTDLHIWKVDGTFPFYAQLYTKSDEPGRPLVVIGRGTQRGAEIDFKRSARGWSWAASDSIQRWGQNIVSSILTYGANNDLLYATFDRMKLGNSGYNEAQLSSGDSGGGVFLKDGGVWKLAGINYAVDGPFYTSAADATGFFGSLFDARGFYSMDAGNYILISGSAPVPSGFYATRISSRLSWILSVIQPPAAL